MEFHEKVLKADIQPAQERESQFVYINDGKPFVCIERMGATLVFGVCRIVSEFLLKFKLAFVYRYGLE